MPSPSSQAEAGPSPALLPAPTGVDRRSLGWRPAVLLAGVAAVVVLGRLWGVGERLEALWAWLADLGPWGPLVFVLIYVAATVAALPGSALTIAGGALFGSFWGIVLVSVGATLGASLAFLLSRYLAREAVVQWLGGSKRFQDLERLTAAHGAVIVALTRLVPLFPFNLLNYAFGLTRVPFFTYVFWSWLCMLPGIALYVVGADVLSQLLARGLIPWKLIMALAGVAGVAALLARAAGRHLQSRPPTPLEGSLEEGESWREPEISPQDEANQALVANVRPSGRQNPAPSGRYNLVVIGGGTAGLVAAVGAAGLGAKVALIERHLLGGDCLNYGCVPSKAIIRSARVLAELRAAPALGIKVPPGVEVDFAAVMARMRRLRAGISHHDSVRRLQELGIQVFAGPAAFAGPDTVVVGGQTLRFSRALIATGGRPVQPAVPGLAAAGFLTNETVFSLTQRPPRLLVLGGGPIGCELAQAFQRLGSQVFLLHKYDRIMNREDPQAAALVQEQFLAEGIQLLLNARPVQVSRTERGKVVVYESQGETAQIEVDEILVGAGRAPNVEGLNLEAAGVRYEPGRGRGVIVNDFLQTSNPRIYAAGDVCLPYQFTHLADAAARLVIQNALFFGRQRFSTLTIPRCTYTDPEVAQVGLSETQARQQGLAVDIFVRPLQEVDRAILDGQTQGFVKILAKAGTDTILGATMVASRAGEMISEVSVAMAAGLGLGALAKVIHPYPTLAEAIRQIGDMYNRTRLTPSRKRWLSRYLAWKR
jgi:pyruvate/2-oxoglutarate dehydrogenase complex dihydrolipoamide dehydrogenase (E3) component/uncharacterized membrane protein YdjX (TVP38/TMEM64 family)